MNNDRLDRIERRLDSIDKNLERHMKRSDALEAQVAPMLELKMEIKTVIKLVKFIGIIAGILEAVHWYIK
jgi:hypothetical protein